MLLSENSKSAPRHKLSVRMLSFCMLFMLMLLVFELFSSGQWSDRIVLEIGLCLVLLFLLRKYGEYTIVLAASLLTIYLAIFTIPIHGGSILGGTIGIIATFLIINYASNTKHFRKVNRAFFIIFMVAYYYFLREDALVKSHWWYDVLSILAASLTIMLTTYFYDHEIERYRSKLQASNKFLQEITDLNPQLIFTKDKKGRFTFVNQAMAKAMGRNTKEFYKKTDLELGVSEEEAAKYEANDKQVLSKGMTISMPINKLHADGRKRWYETIKKPIYDEKQNIIGLLGINNDITNLKEKELEILAAKQKAEQNDLLKSSFLANMSHEIRTPMNSIIGFSELLLDDNLEKQEGREYTRIINQNCKQLLQLVSNILDISKLETTQMKVVESTLDVHKLLRDLHASFLTLATDKGLDLKLLLDKNPQRIFFKTDIQKVRQILTNLISNAIKYTEAGSVLLGYEIKEQQVVFSVQDTGIGINKEAQVTIFERFQRTDKSIEMGYGGTGLGLAISRGFARLLGGDIRLMSSAGKGSVFYLALPYKALDGFMPPIEKSAFKKLPEKQIVLIADDGKFNALLIKKLLNSQQVPSIHAQNGQEAVELVKSEFNKIALVLMDMKMPVMDGKTACKAIKKDYPDLPIIAQTGLDSSSEPTELIDFDDFIQKPINKEDLLKILKKYIPTQARA